MTSRLRLIENHQAFVPHKNCFCLPKLQYILRASLVYRRGNDLKELVTALSTVTNVQIEGGSLKQAVLPVRMGGLGIRILKYIALPAFIKSLQSSGA